MTKKKNLLEAASLASDAPAADGTWKVRLISEGKGSSGTYTAELLENHHKALDNLLSFKNHPTGWDGPQERDFTMIAGKVLGETWVERDERGLTAVYANYLPDPSYKDKLERYKDQLGLSIYIEGSGFYRENADGSEEFVVDWFNPEDPYASVDVVIAPGARGKFMESLKKSYDTARKQESENPSSAAGQENEGEGMDLEKAVADLTKMVTELYEVDKAKQADAAQATADATAVAAAVEAYDASRKLVDEADLPESVRNDILESAKAGKDVAPLIESAKSIKAAVIEAAEGKLVESGSAGRVIGESAARFESATDLGKVFG